MIERCHLYNRPPLIRRVAILPAPLPMLLPMPMLMLLLVLLLAACSDTAVVPPPLTEQALAAVEDDAGAPKDQLARQIDDLFADDAALGETRALIVMYGGAVVAERYAPAYDRDTRFVSWSMAKTVTAVMIGMLVSDGRLRLDESVPEPRWNRPGDARGEITLRQLLQMRSGLRHTEGGAVPYESSEVRMLFLDGRDDMADWATAEPLEAEPGALFEYSSNTTVILADIAARVLTDSTDPDIRRTMVDEYLATRLFAPLGMESMVAEYDANGTLIGGSLMHANARDWARFGEFLRNKGSYRGSQLIPRNWIEFMVQPSPRSEFYGAQTWLNRASGIDRDETLADRGPDTMFAAVGTYGAICAGFARPETDRGAIGT